MEYYSAIKKNEILPFAAMWMELEGIMLSEISQRKTISSVLLVGMQTGAATLESNMEVPQKTKNRTTPQPSNCTTRHSSMGYRCAVSKGHMHPHVYSSTINNSESMERDQMSIDG